MWYYGRALDLLGRNSMLRGILLLLSYCLLTGFNAGSSPCTAHQCIAVVDAGSTGSRLHIYAYDLDSNNSPRAINEVFSKRVQPGFSTIGTDQSTVNHYLKNLFADTPNANMRVYFYATAGMRLLSNEKQLAYYDKLKQWFSTQSQWQLASAKTIKGTEEGLYGWLAVNYELGTLVSSDKPLTGVLDTGGASVQITFPVSNSQNIADEDKVEIDIYGKHIQLFSHSFLGLGQIEFAHHFLDEANCFANNYPLPNGSVGHGDFALCKNEVTTMINTVHHVEKVVRPVLESNTVKTWYALGGLSAIVQDKPILFDNNEFTSRRLAEEANNEVCHQDWGQLTREYPKNDYLYGHCLNASYFFALITDGYGINRDKKIHYFSTKNNFKDWTLGVVLHQE